MDNRVVEIEVSAVPRPQGPLSVGMRFKDLIFLSGQLGKDPRTGLFASDFETQARQALSNLKDILEECGTTMKNVLKVNIFITDIAFLPAMNGVYTEFFETPYPARSTVEVSALAGGARVEIELIAAGGI